MHEGWLFFTLTSVQLGHLTGGQARSRHHISINTLVGMHARSGPDPADYE